MGKILGYMICVFKVLYNLISVSQCEFWSAFRPSQDDEAACRFASESMDTVLKSCSNGTVCAAMPHVFRWDASSLWFPKLRKILR